MHTMNAQKKNPESFTYPSRALDLCPNVFVYGTLMQGHWNHHLLDDLEGREAMTRSDDFKMVAHSYPYAFRAGNGEPGTSITGELYCDVPEDVMRHLDRLEGYPEHYTRIVVGVIDPETGDSLGKAWIYLANLERDRRGFIEGLEEISDGDWARWWKEKRAY